MVKKSSKDGGPRGANVSPRQSRRSRGSQSFGREYSLKEDLAIKRVRSSGKKFSGGCLRVFHYGAGSLPLQVAIKIPRKNGSAPRRNKIKRIIKEIIRTNMTNFTGLGNLVIIADIDPSIKSPFDIVKKDLFDFAGIQ